MHVSVVVVVVGIVVVVAIVVVIVVMALLLLLLLQLLLCRRVGRAVVCFICECEYICLHNECVTTKGITLSLRCVWARAHGIAFKA